MIKNLLILFYAYAPKFIRDKALGPWMGLSQDDLECGEALDRFNRSLDCDRKALDENRYDDVRSFYQIGKRALPRSLNLTREQKQPEALREFWLIPRVILLFYCPWHGEVYGLLVTKIHWPLSYLIQWLIWHCLQLRFWLLFNDVSFGFIFHWCPSGISCFMPLSAIFFLAILSF